MLVQLKAGTPVDALNISGLVLVADDNSGPTKPKT